MNEIKLKIKKNKVVMKDHQLSKSFIINSIKVTILTLFCWIILLILVFKLDIHLTGNIEYKINQRMLKPDIN